MKFNILATSLVSISLSTFSQAWPLLHAFEKRSPQSYSVVPVDGGSTAQPATKTITNAITQTQTSLVTIVSTVTQGGVETPVTIVNTQYIPTTIIQTVPVTVSASPSIMTISQPQETTTMVVAPSLTSIPYDNGQWHTTYYWTSTLSDLVPVSTAADTLVAISSLSVEETATIATSVGVTITSVAEMPNPTQNAATATTTDWATYYGTWR